MGLRLPERDSSVSPSHPGKTISSRAENITTHKSKMLSPEVTVSTVLSIKKFFSLSKQDFFILEEMQW